uniref:Uncharacterized protein n=3 Tax=Canis lupus TaxID=9612 RepID=A0A8C0SVF5_CANLF
MYIKPALPCLPSRGVEHTFLSRPGRGWGEATARGLPASRCGVHTGDRKEGVSGIPSFHCSLPPWLILVESGCPRVQSFWWGGKEIAAQAIGQEFN